MRMHGLFRVARAATMALALVFGITQAARADKLTYLSLGDSVGFGESTFVHDPSNGDRAYVLLYANYLATQNGGVRPNVVNLAVDGDTSSSFFSGTGRVPPGPGYTDPQLASLNTNYQNNAPQIQAVQMINAINSAKAQGQTISNVTVSLGANDLFALAQTPGFLTSSTAQQQADLTTALGKFQSNYTTLLSELKAMLPNANISLLGTYNPFPGAPSSPFAPFAAPAIQALNQVIAGEAKAFGVNYVDTASPFVGKESTYTWITQGGNVHPNGLGYQAIATQIEAVPEPTTLAMFGAGFVALVALHRRRRATAA
jgi:lysophospholipase L1-like esterase